MDQPGVCVLSEHLCPSSEADGTPGALAHGAGHGLGMFNRARVGHWVIHLFGLKTLISGAVPLCCFFINSFKQVHPLAP